MIVVISYPTPKGTNLSSCFRVHSARWWMFCTANSLSYLSFPCFGICCHFCSFAAPLRRLIATSIIVAGFSGCCRFDDPRSVLPKYADLFSTSRTLCRLVAHPAATAACQWWYNKDYSKSRSFILSRALALADLQRPESATTWVCSVITTNDANRMLSRHGVGAGLDLEDDFVMSLIGGSRYLPREYIGITRNWGGRGG